MNTKYPHIEVKLIGQDGNAFAIMGKVKKALKQNNISQDEIDKYMEDSMSGDYNNLLRVAMNWITIL